MTRQTMTTLTVILSLGLVQACTSAGRPLTEVAPEINAARAEQPLSNELAPGDLLFVTFPSSEQQWSHNTTVDDDGNATFNLIGSLQVEGMSLDEVNSLVKERYSALLTGPEVTVHVTMRSARGVHVIGEVGTAGEILFDGGRLSLLDAIGRAGGFNKATAAIQQVVLVRFHGDGSERTQWKIDCRPEQWTAEPVLLQPYDLVFIPNTTIDKVDIWVDQYIRRLIPVPGAVGLLGVQ